MKENQHLKDLMTRGFLHRKEVAALSALLSGEISAVEAYNLAIANVKDIDLISTLEECRNSHSLRVLSLQKRLTILGEEKMESSGWWGVVARFVEHSAVVINDRVAMSVLLTGEDFGFSQYEHYMKDLDVETYTLVEIDLLPAQGRTLQTMSLLCAQLHFESMNEKTENSKDAHKHSRSKTLW